MSLDAKIKKVLRAAEKALGQRRKGTKHPPLETAIHAVLAPGGTDDAAKKAVKALLKAFLDWNEVRVSSWKEIGSILEKSGVADSGAKAMTLKNLLRTIFHRINKISLEAMLPLQLEDARRKMENMEDFPEYAIGAVLSLNMGLDGAYITHGLLRIAARVGIVREASLGTGRRDFERRVPRKDHFRLQQHLSYLASTVCLKTVALCEQCPLNKVCDQGMETLEALAARAREAAEAEKTAAREGRAGKGGARKRAAKPRAKARSKAKSKAKSKAMPKKKATSRSSGQASARARSGKKAGKNKAVKRPSRGTAAKKRRPSKAAKKKR